MPEENETRQFTICDGLMTFNHNASLAVRSRSGTPKAETINRPMVSVPAWVCDKNRDHCRVVMICEYDLKSWRRRVGVEPKHRTRKSRRLMTLRLPPSPNWSQLEPTRKGMSWRNATAHPLFF
jgi:hypothetical protein